MGKSNRCHTDLGLFLVVAAQFVLATAARADVNAVLDPQQAHLLRNPRFDVLVVTILDVDDEGKTNGDPPHIKLGIDEILRGAERAPTMDAVWRAPIDHEDLEGAAPHQLTATLAGVACTATNGAGDRRSAHRLRCWR